jgi:hypothetical protein
MSTAPGRIMGKPSVKALRKRLSGRVANHADKTRAISAVGILFPGPDMQGVEHRPVRALDPMELKRTDPPGLLLLLRWRRGPLVRQFELAHWHTRTHHQSPEWDDYINCRTLTKVTVEAAKLASSDALRQGRSDPDSSPCSRLQRSPGQTFRARPSLRKPPTARGVGRSNRR